MNFLKTLFIVRSKKHTNENTDLDHKIDISKTKSLYPSEDIKEVEEDRKKENINNKIKNSSKYKKIVLLPVLILIIYILNYSYQNISTDSIPSNNNTVPKDNLKEKTENNIDPQLNAKYKSEENTSKNEKQNNKLNKTISTEHYKVRAQKRKLTRLFVNEEDYSFITENKQIVFELKSKYYKKDESILEFGKFTNIGIDCSKIEENKFPDLIAEVSIKGVQKPLKELRKKFITGKKIVFGFDSVSVVTFHDNLEKIYIEGENIIPGLRLSRISNIKDDLFKYEFVCNESKKFHVTRKELSADQGEER